MKGNDLPDVQRAALYIRVSTEEQVMHGLSLSAQRETLLTYAKKHHYKIVDVYADEGITARKKYKNRKEFMRMLEDVQEGLIDVILFIKLDRWFRNVREFYEVQSILEAHNVHWIATEERYDTTTANGRLNLNIRLSIAQDECDRTSERIKFVFQDKVRRGEAISGKVPYGYQIKDKKVVPNPETMKNAQDIFEQYINIGSVRSLRKYVMDKYGIIYSPTGLRIFLQNERYIGKRNGVPCGDAIIEPDVFYHVQEMLKTRAQRVSHSKSGRVYLFSGLVFCAECGNRLSAHMVGQKYIYYRCTKYEKLGLCTHKKRTSELVLERWLLEHLVSCFENYNTITQKALKASAAEPHADIPKIRGKMEKLRDLYLNDLILREDYEKEYENLKSQLEKEDARSVQRPAVPVDIQQIKTMLSGYENLNRANKKAFWNRTIRKIVIDNNDNFTVYPFSPFRK